MDKRCDAGRAVDKWLEEHGHTQTWLAQQIGVANATLWRWLAGQRRPDYDFREKIERITGVAASAWPPRPPRTKAQIGVRHASRKAA